MEDELETVRGHFEDFISNTQAARANSEQDRDYRDHKQWTQQEKDELEARGQAPVVINRIAPKVNFLCGMERASRSDPKALPRTPKHEDSAAAFTEGLRYVVDNNDFDQVASDAFDNYIVEGTEAAIIEVEPETFEIKIKQIPWDRFYYDPHSSRKDLKDARYMGVVIWLDIDEAKSIFKGKEDEIDGLLESDSADTSTFDDKPNWIDKKRKRIRVCQHYWIKDGVWHVAFFSGRIFLIEPKPSADLDENGEPMCPIEAQSAYITRENDRYGEVRAYIWIQDEINKRRSKALHLLSSRQTVGEKGAVDDVNQAKRELAKPDGHIEVAPGMKFDLLNTNDMATGQFKLLQEAKSEIDTVGANSALHGGIGGDLSGRALQSLQQGGATELGRLFDGHRAWKKRIYRQIWNRIKQYWTEERWIRVTDNEDSLKWVGINRRLTVQDVLQGRIEQGDQRSAAIMALMQQSGDPRLNAPAGIENEAADVDMDIILSESPDVVTLQQEQFNKLADLARVYGPNNVPFELLLELTNLPRKKEIISKLQDESSPESAARSEAAQLQKAAVISELEKTQSETQKNLAAADKTQKEATQTEIENFLLMLNPVPVTSVAV